MKMHHGLRLALCLIIAACHIEAVWAQSDTQSVELLARGSSPIPPGAIIGIRPAEDRPEYQDLTPQIAEQLSLKRLEHASRGDLVLRYRFEETGAEGSLADPNFSIAGRTGTGGSTNMQMTLRLRSETQDTTRHRIIMTFELYSPGSPPLWTAHLLGPDDHLNSKYIMSEMIRIGISNIGETTQLVKDIEY